MAEGTIKKVDATQEAEVNSALRYSDFVELPMFTFPRTFVNPDAIQGNFGTLFEAVGGLYDDAVWLNYIYAYNWTQFNNLISNFNAHYHGYGIPNYNQLSNTGAFGVVSSPILPAGLLPGAFYNTGSINGSSDGTEYITNQPPQLAYPLPPETGDSLENSEHVTYIPGGGARIWDSNSGHDNLPSGNYDGFPRQSWNPSYGAFGTGIDVTYSNEAYSPIEELQIVGAKVSLVGGEDCAVVVRIHQSSYATNGFEVMHDSNAIAWAQYDDGDATDEFTYADLTSWDRTIGPAQTICMSLDYINGDPHSCGVQLYARKFRSNVGQDS